MTRITRRPLTHSSGRSDYELDDPFTWQGLAASERIGEPLKRSRWRVLLRVALLAALTAGAALLALDHAGWRSWSIAQGKAILAAVGGTGLPNATGPAPVPAPPAPSSSEPAVRSAAVEDPARVLSIPPAPEAGGPSQGTGAEASPPVTTGSLPPAADTPGEPLPPPTATDPLEKRALAAGLHPGLSRVLLERLTALDYRNAETAITTALAETPDGAVHVWPRQRKPEQALFHVHFVAGAAPDCRRYVVTIAKDGWSTTALPMERCGVKRTAARRS